MLDRLFFTNAAAEPYYQDNYFNIWKFSAHEKNAGRQHRPIVLNFSIMTRGYGVCCNDESFINIFNKYGVDVYLVDWGKDSIFTLSGWTLDMLSDALYEKAVRPLLIEYDVESLNIFGICIGGVIASHMINRGLKSNPDFSKKFHKIAYYGSPIFGARDMGMTRAFQSFYQSMKPYRGFLNGSGISLFTLDMLLSQGLSTAMLGWTWNQFWQEGHKTFDAMVMLTCDDRWVPFAAFMDILEEEFAKKEDKKAFHFDGDVKNIHFFNLVGDSDLLVKPSASIVEWGSSIPSQFASFNQLIFPGGHFIYARPGFLDVKERLAEWFAAPDTQCSYTVA